MNNSIAKYKSNKSIIYFDDLSSNKHHSICNSSMRFIQIKKKNSQIMLAISGLRLSDSKHKKLKFF